MGGEHGGRAMGCGRPYFGWAMGDGEWALRCTLVAALAAAAKARPTLRVRRRWQSVRCLLDHGAQLRAIGDAAQHALHLRIVDIARTGRAPALSTTLTEEELTAGRTAPHFQPESPLSPRKGGSSGSQMSDVI